VQTVLPWEPQLGPNVVNTQVLIKIFNLLPKTGSSVLGNLSAFQTLGQLLTDPFISFFTPDSIPLFLHTVTAAIIVVGFLASFILALRYFRDISKKAYYAKLIKIPFGVAAVASLLQPLFGDLEGRVEYTYMYTKFLSLEGIPAQGGNNPIISILLYGNLNHFFPGFNYLRTLVSTSISPGMALNTINFAQQNQYWLTPLYYLMVIFGVILFAFGIIYFGLFSKFINKIVRTVFKKDTIDILFYGSLVLPFMAITASIIGWIVREVGRHPWSVLGLITYNEIVTPVNITISFLALILFIEFAIFIGGTIAMYVSFQWKVKEKTISIEPEPDLPGDKK
jgi:cytochrome d ubiquinol oxidase subunit I